MKSIYSIYIVLGIFGCTLTSCQDEVDMSYKGPKVVEFKNYYLEKQTRLGLGHFQQAYPNVVASENTTLSALTISQPAVGVTYQDSILVQLVGPQLEGDTEITYQIDAASTAVDGVHFDFVHNTDGKVLIKGNTSSGYIYIDVFNALGASDPDRVTLIVTLAGNSEISPSENYKTFTYNIIK